jgi:putative flavoprotein involved in K+ transport
MMSNVLVIGAGQAGLATGYFLRESKIPFEILEAAPRVGDSWRKRYASLTLFTPRQFSSLPGLGMAGNREGYATRDEFADYLEAYAKRLQLPIRTGTRVQKLARTPEGFVVELSSGEVMHASRVVIATGGFQVPLRPSLASGFGPEVVQLSAEDYRAPSQVGPGPLLVVGDGASGRDIAVELAPGRLTWLATGKPRRLFPERFLGKSIWWWLARLGLLQATPESFFGRLMKRADAFPDRDRNLGSMRRRGIRIVPRLTAAAGRSATFADGTTADVATVIWAIGYKDDSTWISIPGAIDERGTFIHNAGVSPVPGLFFVGRPWQRNRASALIMGAGPDAQVIVEQIAKQS